MTRPLRPSTKQLVDTGRRLRQRIPRSQLATLNTSDRDPLGILREQNSTRLQELIPLRTERMSHSAFAFYRGTAAIMAADLATSPTTDIRVAACGDAHVANFGFYASPQRTLVFDLNDFDEAAVAPWEWDLKRLVASVIIGGRDAGRDAALVESTARRTALAYRHALRASLAMTPLERYFTHFDPEGGVAQSLDRPSRRALKAAIAGARKRTGARAVRRLTTRGSDGRLAFVSMPPTMTPLPPDRLDLAQQAIDGYLGTVKPDVALMMSQYAQVDTARRVVGVGSVGTRCVLVAFQDGDGHGLIMQAKEAGPSVLEQYGRIAQPAVVTDRVAEHGQGARVVSLQRILQAVSDPFLGWVQLDDVDLYVRQFHDLKGGFEFAELEDRPYLDYSLACAITLARAHSQSGQAAVAAGYIGSGRAVADAIVQWSLAYADLAEADYRAFLAA